MVRSLAIGVASFATTILLILAQSPMPTPVG